MNKTLKIILISLMGLSLLTGCGKKEEQEPPIKVNTNENVIKDQEVEGLTMTNTSLVYENGTTTLVTEVTNNTKEDYPVKRIKITVKDKEGNIITTLIGTIADTIKPGESRIIDSDTPIDLSEAESIEYSVIK